MDDGGLARFQKRMRAIPKAVRASVQPALVKGAEEIAGMARHLAPEETGALKGSIAVTGPNQATPPYSQPGGSMTVGENQAAVTVGDTAVRYAHLVEYGTRRTPAHPFFWPAFRLMRKRATNRIKRAVSKAVRDNWGRP
ncbi:MAG: HK97 gp10 family phage protein [Rhodovulum sp.]|nr:HK97 gp10 family phage protein [Rhodovulum sp.]